MQISDRRLAELACPLGRVVDGSQETETARVPGPEHHFLINPYGWLFSEITASSLVKVDLDGRTVDASPHPINPAGFTIHSAIHGAREDALCVLHVHSVNGVAISAQRDGLLPLSQHSMFALSSLVDSFGKIPLWTLVAVYVIQSIGELCLSPIGLSMTTKLAPVRLVGLGMGGWFLSTGIGNNLSGIFASFVSGESGMTVQSALSGYTFGFWALIGSGVLLFLIAPLIQKLMHGVK